MKIRALMILLFLNFGCCFAYGSQNILSGLYKKLGYFLAQGPSKILSGRYKNYPSCEERERILFKRMNFGVGGLIVLGIGGYSLQRYKLRKYWSEILFDGINNDNMRLVQVAMDHLGKNLTYLAPRHLDYYERERRWSTGSLIGSVGQINLSGNTGKPPLFWAVERGSLGLAVLLLRNGANPNTVDSQGRTVLHLVAYKGNLDMLQVLLEEKIDIRSRDNNGCTPLHKAFQYFKNRSVQKFDYEDDHKIKMIEHLLESGALLSDVDKEGRTPLDYCDNEKMRFKLACILEGEIKKNTVVKDKP